MSELRIVKEEAVIQEIAESNDLGITYTARIYKESDTIPVSSIWSDKEAVELLGLNDSDWEEIATGIYYREDLHELITLSINFKESGLTRERYMELMKEYHG